MRSRALSPITSAKAQLRKEIGYQLGLIEEEEIEKQSWTVQRTLIESRQFQAAQRISVYVNTKAEILTDRIIHECLRLGKELFIPHFRRKDPRMRMLRLNGLNEFENLDSTLWNIRQHSQDTEAEEYVGTGALDLIVMPGVAFTRNGDRLGHGMGYYDKMLAEHEDLFGKQPMKVALALNEQIIPNVPLHPTDISIDSILFEEELSKKEMTMRIGRRDSHQS
ncbi:unnamed protein product, partial [Mesorhabditis belari]|uniref:5-formyltetrahydrofolate cyclo-ligase n=1 Tax=Mesorhabditis belari TaxID=2138241 RepID=A0AAF3EFN6_9BILA